MKKIDISVETTKFNLKILNEDESLPCTIALTWQGPNGQSYKGQHHFCGHCYLNKVKSVFQDKTSTQTAQCFPSEQNTKRNRASLPWSMWLWFMVYGFFLFLFFLYFLQNQNLQKWASSQPTFGTCASQRTHKREPWRRSLGPQIIVRLWRQRWSPFCRLSSPFISAAVTLLCPISSWTTKGFNTYRIGKPQVSGPEPEWEEKWCLFLHLNTW